MKYPLFPAVGVLLAQFSACYAAVPDRPRPVMAPPDISGTWERYPEDWAGKDPDNPQPPGGPFDLNEPYAQSLADLKKKKAAADAAGTPIANSSTLCLPEGMPTIMEAIYPIQIVQTTGQVIVLAEFLTQTRRIWLDEKMPPTDQIPPLYYGHSVGHWEGDTLVVETAGIRPDVTFHDIPHTPAMRLTERIRKAKSNMLEDRVTIDDPVIFKKPYSFTLSYRKSNYKISEYYCENNQIVVDKNGGSHLNLQSKEH